MCIYPHIFTSTQYRNSVLNVADEESLFHPKGTNSSSGPIPQSRALAGKIYILMMEGENQGEHVRQDQDQDQDPLAVW